MTTFLDIAEEVKTVTISGVELPLRGLSYSDQARLYQRFPSFAGMMQGKGQDGETIMVPELIAWVVAAGLGYADHEEAIAKASRLPLDQQFDIAGEVFKMTWPGVIDPFAKKMQEIGARYRKAMEKAVTRKPAATRKRQPRSSKN